MMRLAPSRIAARISSPHAVGGGPSAQRRPSIREQACGGGHLDHGGVAIGQQTVNQILRKSGPVQGTSARWPPMAAETPPRSSPPSATGMGDHLCIRHVAQKGLPHQLANLREDRGPEGVRHEIHFDAQVSSSLDARGGRKAAPVQSQVGPR